MGWDPFHQTRLLKAASNLALNTAREGAATASVGNLGQGLTTPIVKNFQLKLDTPKTGGSHRSCHHGMMERKKTGKS